MQASSVSTAAYAKVIANSKRVRWGIESDVLRGRRFDLSKPFLPSGLSLADELPFLGERDRRLFSQVQGRSYAYIFGLVERFIGAKVLDLSRAHALGDQVALEALVRMTDEEIKHQELFRRLEALMDADMPAGYRPAAEPNAVAAAVLEKEHVGGAGADPAHRAVHAGALPRQHRRRGRHLRALARRVPVPLEGGVAARRARRARVPERGRPAHAGAA